jgi:hypothetical protein
MKALAVGALLRFRARTSAPNKLGRDPLIWLAGKGSRGSRHEKCRSHSWGPRCPNCHGGRRLFRICRPRVMFDKVQSRTRRPVDVDPRFEAKDCVTAPDHERQDSQNYWARSFTLLPRVQDSPTSDRNNTAESLLPGNAFADKIESRGRQGLIPQNPSDGTKCSEELTAGISGVTGRSIRCSTRFSPVWLFPIYRRGPLRPGLIKSVCNTCILGGYNFESIMPFLWAGRSARTPTLRGGGLGPPPPGSPALRPSGNSARRPPGSPERPFPSPAAHRTIPARPRALAPPPGPRTWQPRGGPRPRPALAQAWPRTPAARVHVPDRRRP